MAPVAPDDGRERLYYNPDSVAVPDHGLHNCSTEGTAYTVQAAVVDDDSRVELTFCSSDCLADWV
jgi:hypothetical protein